MSGDAFTDLLRAIEAQARAEERLAKAAYALAEAEEAAEDGTPDAVAAVERCRRLYEAADAAVGFARARRREIEAGLAPAEVLRAYSQRPTDTDTAKPRQRPVRPRPA